MKFEIEKILRYCYSPILFDMLKFNEILADKKFIMRLATDQAKMLFGYLKDIRFYLKFIDECAKRYPSFNIKKIRKNCIIVEDFTNEFLYIFIKDKYNIKTLMEIKNMKFDVAIMNPPYDGNLHLKILEKIIPIADKVVNISPVRWLLDPLAKYKKNSDYNKFEESISKNIESLEVIDAKTAKGLFGAIFGSDLGIYTCCNTTSNCIYTDLIDNITKRVVQYMIKNHATFDYNKKDGVRIRIPTICGGKSGGSGKISKVRLCEVRNCLGHPLVFTDGLLGGKKWHEYYSKNQYSKTTDEITCSIKFDSKAEADNFFASVNTQFYKYIHHNVVLDVHVEECKILFMSDYTQPWNDKRFCEYFGITGYISDTEAEPNSEWEIILNTMKEYV